MSAAVESFARLGAVGGGTQDVQADLLEVKGVPQDFVGHANRTDSKSIGITPGYSNVVVLPARVDVSRTRDVVEVKEKLEGVVDVVCKDYFVARTASMMRNGERQLYQEKELVEIGFENLSEDDLGLVEPGAVFYWSVGLRKTKFGTVSHFSTIRFRRMPLFSRRDLQEAKKASEDLIEELFGDI